MNFLSGLPLSPSRCVPPVQSTEEKREAPWVHLPGALQMPEDTVQFRRGGAVAASQESIVSELRIPYRFKLFRRKKKAETSEMSVYFPRTLEPRRLPGHLKGVKLIALGDLHGSYQKLAETLIATGLVTMPPESAKRFQELSNAFTKAIASERDYPLARNAYQSYVASKLNGKSHEKSLAALQKGGFSAEEIEDVSRRRSLYKDYYRQLQPLIQEMEWVGKAGQQLLLIGDALSDRGPLDHLTLDIIERLNQGSPGRMVWLASNHDHAGMQSLVHKRLVLGWETAGSLGRSLLISDEPNRVQVQLATEGEGVKLRIGPTPQAESGKNFAARYKHYLQESKLMHYKPDSRTLFTHAPIIEQDLGALHDVLRKLYPECIEASQDRLDAIHSREQIPLGAGWANRFWNTYVTQVFHDKALKMPVEKMLVGERESDGFLWRRDKLDEATELPFYGGGVKALVHGHDWDSKESRFSIQKQFSHADVIPDYTVVNLDQETRKGFQIKPTEENSLLYVEF